MFRNRLPTFEETLTGSDLLAEIGLHPGAIRDVIDDEPRHTLSRSGGMPAGGDPLTVTAALSAGTE